MDPLPSQFLRFQNLFESQIIKLRENNPNKNIKLYVYKSVKLVKLIMYSPLRAFGFYEQMLFFYIYHYIYH